MARSLRIKQMLYNIITAKIHLLNIGRLTMDLIFAAMKNYLKLLYNWFFNVVKKISSVRIELFNAPGKYSRDKESQAVLFI